MEIQKQIGISTLALRNMSLDDAIDAVHRAGLKIFELVPRLYGGPRSFSAEMRQRIKDKLLCFDAVTIHTSTPTLADERPVNIASSDKWYRRDSRNNYLDHIGLALDLDASIVTFHPGKQDENSSREQVREANLEFAQSALAFAAGNNLKMGFEYFDIDLAEKIGPDRFGVLFDFGHAALQSEEAMTEEVIRLMNLLAPLTVEYHLHGIKVTRTGEKEDHRSFQDNNGLDYDRILLEAKKKYTRVPFIFEIGIWDEQGAEKNLNDTLYASEEIQRIWKSW